MAEQDEKYANQGLIGGHIAGIAKYAGMIAGIAGVVDDLDPVKIGIGGLVYLVGCSIKIGADSRIKLYYGNMFEDSLENKIKKIIGKQE